MRASKVVFFVEVFYDRQQEVSTLHLTLVDGVAERVDDVVDLFYRDLRQLSHDVNDVVWYADGDLFQLSTFTRSWS